MKPGNPIYLAGFDTPLQVIGEDEEILILTFFGRVKATVKRNEFLKGFDGEYYAEDEHNIYDLAFCDERKYWVSGCSFNKACLDKLDIKVKPMNAD
jgi:hypothetical protein